ncbi:MAG: DASS family sodium-coupled anion symporter [Hyphomicrobiaceae bacterium]
MTSRRIGFWLGLAAFAFTLLTAAPAGMPALAWPVAGMVAWMATWWMTEAMPLSATAFIPFLVLPLIGVADANATAAAYFSPIMFLFLGGAFLGLAIERTGLHCRLAFALLGRFGRSRHQLLLGLMLATALISTVISNTSTAFIMMPLAVAVLAAGGVQEGAQDGMAGALPLGVAFAATIGGLGTIVGSPVNAIGVALIERTLPIDITFAMWSAFGMPIVLVGVPLAGLIIARVQRIDKDSFNPLAAREAIPHGAPWSPAERRLGLLFALAVLAWVGQPVLEPLFPAGGLTDGTIAALAGLALFAVPDGTGRPLLVWREANRAPWDIVFMFGGGLALAMGMGESGLADWLGRMLLPLKGVPIALVALALVAMVILITEFASNVATASGMVPVVASLITALGADPILLAMPAAIAASWGFMLPAGTGPNAIAWATGHVAMPRMLRAGLLLDVAGAFLIVAVVWAVASVLPGR